jgi:hypothetical protein
MGTEPTAFVSGTGLSTNRTPNHKTSFQLSVTYLSPHQEQLLYCAEGTALEGGQVRPLLAGPPLPLALIAQNWAGLTHLGI